MQLASLFRQERTICCQQWPIQVHAVIFLKDLVLSDWNLHTFISLYSSPKHNQHYKIIRFQANLNLRFLLSVYAMECRLLNQWQWTIFQKIFSHISRSFICVIAKFLTLSRGALQMLSMFRTLIPFIFTNENPIFIRS